MAKKDEKKTLYSCNLELVRINEYNLRYRVVNEEGLDLDVHHLEFDRKGFPRDDNFNMDFLNMKIVDPEPVPDPKDPENPVPVTDKEYADYLAHKRGAEMMRKKQAEFRKLLKLRLTITE